MDKVLTLTADADYQRADIFLSAAAGISRSAVKTLTQSGGITKNGSICKASSQVKSGDVFCVQMPDLSPLQALPQNIKIDIVYEDDFVAVINKPQGMTVHPAAGSPDNTLVNALLYHMPSLSRINGELRPGIVHRLDKDTSGLLVVAKTDKAHISLSQQIADKSCRRIYYALARGTIKADSGTINAPLARSFADRKKIAVMPGGREATTHFEVIKRFSAFTFVRLELKTGRTHQIRVHLKHIGHPIAGDSVYGNPKSKPQLSVLGQLLHSHTLMFTHPNTGEHMAFSARLPDYFCKTLQKLAQSALQNSGGLL